MSTQDPQNGSMERDDALVAHALGELSAEERAAFEARLREDPELAREAEALRKSFELIGHAAVTPPPPALRERVLAAAARPPARGIETAARPPAKVIRPTRWIRRAALAAMAASVVFAIGLDDYRLRRELALMREVNETLHAPNVVVSFDLRGTGPAGAYGQAVLDLDAKKAALVVSGLPALEKGQAYWLWAMVGDEAVPCGRFEVQSDERIVRQFAIPVKDYTEPVRQLLLTIEPAAEADGPEGPTVMRSI